MALLLDDPPAVDEPRPQSWTAQWRSRERLLAVMVPIVLLAIAGGVRFHRLSVPERCYFDETYYYYDARTYLERGVEDGFAVHPPVGKWLIAAGLTLFGVDEGSPIDAAVTTEPDRCTSEEDPNPAAAMRERAEAFARRAMPALAGTLLVVVTYWMGLLLFRRRGFAALAALLVALDGLALTMSRIAMLDIFVTLFIAVGALLLLMDLDRMWREAPADPPVEPDPDALPRRRLTFRWLAGLAFGLALATKWSALLAIGAAGVLLVIEEARWRYRWTGRWWSGWPFAAASIFLALVTVPLIVYVASYVSWFANFDATRKADRCEPGACPVTEVAGGWLEEQGEIFRFHRDLEADHPYRAPAWTWPALARPVAYYYESCTEPSEGCAVAEGHVAEILGIGTPTIWWMALVAAPFLVWWALWQRDRRGWLILGFLILQTFPYVLSPRPVFLFYATPAVPFLALALAYASGRAHRLDGMRWIPLAVGVLAVAGFLFWYPILTAVELPKGSWDARIWIRPGWI